jgi:inner membrane protein
MEYQRQHRQGTKWWTCGKAEVMFDWFLTPPLGWAVVGLLLLIAELATVSFILCFIGLGALIVALTTWLGITPSLSSQLIVFSSSSLLLLLLLRKTARKLFAGHADMPPDYAGEKVKVIKAIPAGGEGTIQYRGSDWMAFSDTAQTIPEGAVVQIESIEGIRVKVKPVA